MFFFAMNERNGVRLRPAILMNYMVKIYAPAVVNAFQFQK